MGDRQTAAAWLRSTRSSAQGLGQAGLNDASVNKDRTRAIEVSGKLVLGPAGSPA